MHSWDKLVPFSKGNQEPSSWRVRIQQKSRKDGDPCATNPQPSGEVRWQK